MDKAPRTLLVAAAVTVAIGLLDGQGWPSWVIGAVLALSLWVMLFLGSLAGAERYVVPPLSYAGAALAAVAVGAVLVWMTGTSAFWVVGFIVAGAVVPATRAAARDLS